MKNESHAAKENKIIFIPSLRKTNGTGHLVRCLELSKFIPGSKIFLCASPEKNNWSAKELFIRFPELEKKAVVDVFDILDHYDYIVLDDRKTKKMIFSYLKPDAFIIGIDEGSVLKKKIPLLIDILPPLHSVANIINPALLGLVAIEHHSAEKPKILVSFGGEDSGDLTSLVCRTILSLQKRSGKIYDIIINYGPLYSGTARQFGFPEVQYHGELKNKLEQYDVLITHYGLAAWEAAALGLSVILFNPTSYHHALGIKSGFFSLGSRKIKIINLQSALEKKCIPEKARRMIKEGQGLTAKELFDSVLVHANRGCPLCHKSVNKVLFRQKDRSFCRCTFCGLFYMQKLMSQNDPQYSEAYFEEEYRKQYGKTYLQDFDSIKKSGKKRVACLLKLGLKKESVVLDVGCAYGPFLSAVSDAGLVPYGLDVAVLAVEYVQKNLGFPAWNGSFLDCDLSKMNLQKHVDVLTFWYVLEHFPGLDLVLKKINELTCAGSFVAMALPHAAGISAKKNRNNFFASSPRDHYSLFTQMSLIHMMKKQGYKHRKTIVTGHHPERFPFYAKPLRGFYDFLSRVFRLGDTFEIYFQRSDR